ncbi:hypothetical protein BU24DRAFT_406721 [Aaosphaeria arxii CBS 175.79]|uniref:BYS1 domain protein n=1 Tax=Aaosphaeria arxii CBS 175.79 TaxID=1450172 RepID=A0A6A5Y4D0_9PLEO|nr:uncharacterized protein BU24DRAFT_406721 [Aaosphaeria arxii CBS 175.79]KAF2020129.1 hypothetical protein BU24DRAFT_406721 [Aaosphaeria arxii CBS 175.79]
MRFIAASLIAFATAVTAVGNAVVSNGSDEPFYVWSVGSTVGERREVLPGSAIVEAFRHDAQTGGIALKITKTNDGLYTGAPTQIFSYSLDGEQVWFDLSTVFGDPFKGHKITVESANGPKIEWPTGTHPGGSQVKVAPSKNDVFFTLHK